MITVETEMAIIVFSAMLFFLGTTIFVANIASRRTSALFEAQLDLQLNIDRLTATQLRVAAQGWRDRASSLVARNIATHSPAVYAAIADDLDARAAKLEHCDDRA